jgi:hypothetical protein
VRPVDADRGAGSQHQQQHCRAERHDLRDAAPGRRDRLAKSVAQRQAGAGAARARERHEQGAAERQALQRAAKTTVD